MTRSTGAPVLVTGATGQVGSGVVDRLLQAGVPVRALTHRAEATGDLPSGVEWVVGDLRVPESLNAALDGVSAVFLVWTAPPESVAAIVDRLAAQVPRVTFLSAPFRTPHPFFQQPNPMASLYSQIEDLLAASRLDLTIIRPGMFASNALNWWGPTIRSGAAVRWPYGAAPTAPIDEQDVAAAAALTLYRDGHAGKDYVLTGSESLTQAEQVQIIADTLGRPVPFVELSPDEYRRETEGTWPRPVVEMLLAAWDAALGTPAFVTSTVFDVLGVSPRSFRQWALDHARAFAADHIS